MQGLKNKTHCRCKQDIKNAENNGNNNRRNQNDSDRSYNIITSWPNNFLEFSTTLFEKLQNTLHVKSPLYSSKKNMMLYVFSNKKTGAAGLEPATTGFGDQDSTD